MVGLVVFANGVVGVLGVSSVVGVFCWAGVAIVVVAWVRGVARDFVLFGFFVCFIGVLIALRLSYFDISAIRSSVIAFVDFSKVV